MIFPFALAACATEPLSEGQVLINERAKMRAKDEKFPVLRPLPGREALGEGLPGNPRQELAETALAMRLLTEQAAEAPNGSDIDAVAGELRALVAELQRGSTVRGPEVDVEALGFPTPPPLN
ncbi:hypothetical protein NOG11_07650 [Parvularcula sp. BGMRC 0090]|uniref:Uncharacterized protein n=1 Tax=Parvularcula maris TaxID=2965077 RepID=A0A9X2RHT4_9PROT|nr:hypothetical protein [Parvularcula maris]